MTATRYNVPPSSTLLMTVLVPRTSPSRNPCTARSSRQLFWGTERTPNVLPLPRISACRKPGLRNSVHIGSSAPDKPSEEQLSRPSLV